MASDNGVINIEIWSSFQFGKICWFSQVFKLESINANVIENKSKITKDPKIAKDPTFKKRNPTQNPETQPENFSNLSGGSKIHSGKCVFYQVRLWVTSNLTHLLLTPTISSNVKLLSWFLVARVQVQIARILLFIPRWLRL